MYIYDELFLLVITPNNIQTESIGTLYEGGSAQFQVVQCRIDCINDFVHRKMNLKNRIAHFFMKAEGIKKCAVRFFRRS